MFHYALAFAFVLDWLPLWFRFLSNFLLFLRPVLIVVLIVSWSNFLIIYWYVFLNVLLSIYWCVLLNIKGRIFFLYDFIVLYRKVDLIHLHWFFFDQVLRLHFLDVLRLSLLDFSPYDSFFYLIIIIILRLIPFISN